MTDLSRVMVLVAAVLCASCGPTNSTVEAVDVPDSSTTLAKFRRAIGVERGPTYREVMLPVGTVLHLQLRESVASDTSNVQDVVSADLVRPVVINGRDVVPAGATVSGMVSEADAAGAVKGRARVSLMFVSLSASGRDYPITTSGYARTAPATKGEDATKIGVGAGIGAAVGAVLGGKKGAAGGAAIGGGAGTGLVLATSGPEVRFGPGSDVTTRLTAPVAVRVAN